MYKSLHLTLDYHLPKAMSTQQHWSMPGISQGCIETSNVFGCGHVTTHSMMRPQHDSCKKCKSTRLLVADHK